MEAMEIPERRAENCVEQPGAVAPSSGGFVHFPPAWRESVPRKFGKLGRSIEAAVAGRVGPEVSACAGDDMLAYSGEP